MPLHKNIKYIKRLRLKTGVFFLTPSEVHVNSRKQLFPTGTGNVINTLSFVRCNRCGAVIDPEG
jgi:hypothetical protein